MPKNRRYKNPNYTTEYMKANYEMMGVIARREFRYKERIKILADDEGISVSAWILRAIDNELRRESGDYDD